MKKITIRETWHRLNMDIDIYVRYTRIEKLSYIKWLSCFLTPSIQVMLLHRVSRFFYTLNLILFGADIGMLSDIDGGCHIPHPVGIVIFGKLGKNIFISQAVGVGGGTSSEINIGAGPGLPVIESDVYLGAKSTIAGPVRLGRGSLVGFHSLVIKDIPERTIARGTPAINTRKLLPRELEVLTSIPLTKKID